MDSLPHELLSQILLYLPRNSYATLRTTSHAFNDVLSPALFTHLKGFLDLHAAEDQVARGANNPLLRPVSIWSPESWPPRDFALSAPFLTALYSAIAYEPWGPGGTGGLDGDNFGELVSMADLTGSKLRQIQFLYKMYLEYTGSDTSVLDAAPTTVTMEVMDSSSTKLPEGGVTPSFPVDDELMRQNMHQQTVMGQETVMVR